MSLDARFDDLRSEKDKYLAELDSIDKVICDVETLDIPDFEKRELLKELERSKSQAKVTFDETIAILGRELVFSNKGIAEKLQGLDQELAKARTIVSERVGDSSEVVDDLERKKAQVEQMLDESNKKIAEIRLLMRELDESEFCDVDSGCDATDWARTSLTPQQEAVVRAMEERGELDIPMPSVCDEPQPSEIHLPTESTGVFMGEKGNSEFIPTSLKAIEKMKQYQRDHVEYKKGYPDFSPFVVHQSEWGIINCEVIIPHMTDKRRNGSYDMGRRPKGTSHNIYYDLGNFAQADNALATVIGIAGEDIEAFRKANCLVWHECEDGKTMQLVPREIHEACIHSGGVSEMKYRMAYGDSDKIF